MNQNAPPLPKKGGSRWLNDPGINAVSRQIPDRQHCPLSWWPAPGMWTVAVFRHSAVHSRFVPPRSAALVHALCLQKQPAQAKKWPR